MYAEIIVIYFRLYRNITIKFRDIASAQKKLLSYLIIVYFSNTLLLNQLSEKFADIWIKKEFFASRERATPLHRLFLPWTGHVTNCETLTVAADREFNRRLFFPRFISMAVNRRVKYL